ncbi:SDR family NAD(P)-dependent oxidoreductase [Streptomyces sp. NPDC002133]|uniref:SDR family NAD(P)-dependent oxidoreductase n=1 Tax=Streptomyces sp. NPDC002133 TaxID=3154409 RepID=UPI00331A1820
MKLNGARVLVAGATGAIGAALSGELRARGALLVLAGRDQGRLARTAEALGDARTAVFDAYDVNSCARAVKVAKEALGGLDAVVTAFGSVAFGSADETGDAIAEHLMTVNALAPAAFFRGALRAFDAGETIAAVTGAVVERPQPGMADYSASKCALSAWLEAVRREAPAGIRVLEIRLGHLDTGFAGRAVAGTPPPLPPGGDLGTAVRSVADALETDARRVRTAPDGTPFLERQGR